jgi:hypothetical protein
MMLIGSGALAVIPRRVAADVAAVLPLIMLLLPFPSSRAKLSMIWHRRLDNDPAQRWLTGTLRAAVNRNGDSGRRPNNGPRHGSGRPAQVRGYRPNEASPERSNPVRIITEHIGIAEPEDLAFHMKKQEPS